MLYIYRNIYSTLIICIIFFSSLYVSATPAVTPSCSGGETNRVGLKLTTYDTTGLSAHPTNHAEYNTLVANYGIPAKEFGSGIVSNVNGSGNPYGSNDNYLSLFTGYIEAPTTGVYGIGVDGDDAIEVIIDGVTLTGWYGGHGKAGSAQYTVDVNLDAGYHTIEFRHEEIGGGDNYYLYWKKPGDSGYSIVPAANFSSCQSTLPLKPAISPTCASPSPQLLLSTYDTTGYGTYPSNSSDYDTLVTDYAIPAKLFGSGLVSTIDGSGNPYGPDAEYLSVFKGYLYVPVDGYYQIGIDGDDAVEVLIDGEVITGWYGGHGKAGSAQYITDVNLQAGYHDLEFRQQEKSGGDNYYLYWKKPGDTTMSITPAENLAHCPYEASISLKKVSKVLTDPFNGTIGPKAIPGAVIEYTLTAVNSGSAPSDDSTIKDSLDDIITTQQTALWASGFITIKTPNLYGGSKTTLTDATDSDEGEFNDTAGNRLLIVNCGTLTTSQSCEVTYRIIVN